MTTINQSLGEIRERFDKRDATREDYADMAQELLTLFDLAQFCETSDKGRVVAAIPAGEEGIWPIVFMADGSCYQLTSTESIDVDEHWTPLAPTPHSPAHQRMIADRAYARAHESVPQ